MLCYKDYYMLICADSFIILISCITDLSKNIFYDSFLLYSLGAQ